MTPEQIARLSLEIGREVTELVQRRLADAAKWGAPANRPVHEDEQPVGTFAPYFSADGRLKPMTEAEIFDDGHPRYGDGGVAADAKRVVRGQEPLQPKPPAESDGA